MWGVDEYACFIYIIAHPIGQIGFIQYLLQL